MPLTTYSQYQERTFRKVLFQFIFRVILFACLQSVSHFILQSKIENSSRIVENWPISDVIASSCCCWLAITIILGIIEGGKTIFGKPKVKQELHQDSIDDQDDEQETHPPPLYAEKYSVLLIPRINWYEQGLKDANFTRCMEVRGGVMSRETLPCAKIYITPWELWYNIYACGLSIFVFGYSINGLSLLPEVSAILSSIVIFPLVYKKSNRFQMIAAVGVALSLVLIAIGDIAIDPRTWIQWMWNNLWLGILVPIMCINVLGKCSIQAKALGVSAQNILKFAMPSLAMLSVTYLSFMAVPYPDTFSIVNIETNQTHENSSYVLALNDNFNKANQNTSSSLLPQSEFAQLLSNWGNSSQIKYMQDFLNSRKGFEAIFEVKTAASIISILLAPVFLWCTMITMIGAAMRGTTNAQNAFSAYALVLVVKQFILTTGEHDDRAWVIAAIVMAVPACIMTIFAEVYDENNECCLHIADDSLDIASV